MASDYLLEIDGIKGESRDDKHKDAIDVMSFSWGASNPGSFATGGGGGAGKVSFSDISFMSQVNKSSPELMTACATGKHINARILQSHL
jgi:type VI secretion system secreted protein Hcp